jgi:3D (Asp-Asp-Asp) domain-containing protein
LTKDEVPVDRYANILHGLLPYEKEMAQTALDVAKEEAEKLVSSKDEQKEGESPSKRKASCDSSKTKEEGLQHSTAPAQKKRKKVTAEQFSGGSADEAVDDTTAADPPLLTKSTLETVARDPGVIRVIEFDINGKFVKEDTFS